MPLNQRQIDNFKNSLEADEAALLDKLNTLNASIAEQQSKLDPIRKELSCIQFCKRHFQDYINIVVNGPV